MTESAGPSNMRLQISYPPAARNLAGLCMICSPPALLGLCHKHP